MHSLEDGLKSSCLMVTERQEYYRLVRGAVDLRNLQPQDFKWLPNSLSTAQSNVALEKSQKRREKNLKNI